jgi:hypothetical protein
MPVAAAAPEQVFHSSQRRQALGILLLKRFWRSPPLLLRSLFPYKFCEIGDSLLMAANVPQA